MQTVGTQEGLSRTVADRPIDQEHDTTGSESPALQIWESDYPFWNIMIEGVNDSMNRRYQELPNL
jgi:hypothetical protein